MCEYVCAAGVFALNAQVAAALKSPAPNTAPRASQATADVDDGEKRLGVLCLPLRWGGDVLVCGDTCSFVRAFLPKKRLCFRCPRCLRLRVCCCMHVFAACLPHVCVCVAACMCSCAVAQPCIRG